MSNKRITLNEAIKFHGHLGPYLVLGLLAGNLAFEKIGFKKYFGIRIKVWGASKKPKSCLIDGLQLSSGATYGKGNIEKLNSSKIKIDFINEENNKKISFVFKKPIIKLLQKVKTHAESEILAKELYKTNLSEIFNIASIN
ncbi:MAG: formylmethanofuran dehydrogenase subunit E family protein [Candidatus Omnitrophota bacterium]